MALITARIDPELSARILHRSPLHYDLGADASLDRPAHVRSGSGLAHFEGKLAVVQDDANFIALLDMQSGAVEAVPLPAGHQGARQFDNRRGNKKYKLDLESCFVAEDNGGPLLVAVGSGSKRIRECVVLCARNRAGELEARVVHVPRLFESLRMHPEFATSELNLEGALLHEGYVRLFQRSNGLATGKRTPRCATCELSWPELRALLDAPESAPVPQPERVRQYDLGAIDGVPLTFTDATLLPSGFVLFLASAEASPDAYQDGEVRGTALGLIDQAGQARLCLLCDERGELLREKAEGIAPGPQDPDRLFVVFDPDDALRAADLAEVGLTGAWHRSATE